jgi:hypothetical protein
MAEAFDSGVFVGDTIELAEEIRSLAFAEYAHPLEEPAGGALGTGFRRIAGRRGCPPSPRTTI